MSNDITAKSAQCYLTYNSDQGWVEIESIQTGKVVKLNTYPDSHNWHVLSIPEREFVLSILNTGDPDDCEVTLTYDVMKRWQLLCQSFDRAQQMSKPAAPAPTIVPSKPTQQSFTTPIDAGNGKHVQVVSVQPIKPEDVKPSATNTTTCTPVAAAPPLPERKDPPASASTAVAGNSLATLQARVDNRAWYGKGEDVEERRINALKDAIEQAEEGYYMIDWDILERSDVPPSPLHKCSMPASEEGGKAWVFRGMDSFSIASSKSVRVITRRNLNHPQVERFCRTLRFHGATLNIWPFDPSASDSIKEHLVRQMDARVRARHTALITNIDRANTTLRDALVRLERMEREGTPITGEKSPDDLQEARDNAVRGHIRKACEALDASILCAEAFDMTDCLDDLHKGFRAAIRSQAEAFNAHARMLRVTLAPMPK